MRKSGAFPTANHIALCPVCQARDKQSGIAGGSLTASIDLGRSTVVQHDSLSLLQLAAALPSSFDAAPQLWGSAFTDTMGIKIGRLDFKAHGLLGTAGLFLLGAALCCSTDTARYLIMASIPVTTGLAYGSYALLGHAPERTVIARGIVAPHREAYKRAIGVVLYVNVRLAWACDLLGARLYGVACALLAARLAPTKAFDNGNTFVFVVPIFCGVGLDAVRQLRCIAAQECAWNAEVATLRTVAAVQFVALLVSFAFTLGFRGYIRLARLYALSAGAVAGILGALAGGGLTGAVAVGMISAFLLDRWIAARPPPDPKTLKTLAAVAKALEAEPAVRRNARSFAELGTEDVAKVTPPVESSVKPNPRSFGELGEAAAAEPKKPNLLARARSWLAASVDEEELDGPEDRIAVDPTHDDVRRCLALVPEAFAAHPSAEAWARQALIVQRGNVEYAAKKLTKLAAFRDRYGWAYRLDVDDRVAKALRSDMHWVLPGTDRRGRRVVVYNARALRASTDLEALQKSLCLLLERITLDEETVRRGVVVVADCSGYSLSMLRKLSVVDARRGSDMVGDFPCRLRMIYAVNLPTLLSPVASFIRACLSKRQKDRLRVNVSLSKLPDFDPRRLPPSLGGSLEFDWAALAEGVVEGGVPE